MTTSPKARFLADEKAARTWQDAADSDLFARASEAAMLMYQDELAGSAVEATEPASAFNRLMGARRFLLILKGLADRPVPPPDRANYSLDHNLR